MTAGDSNENHIATYYSWGRNYKASSTPLGLQFQQ